MHLTKQKTVRKGFVLFPSMDCGRNFQVYRKRAGLKKWKDAFKVLRRNCETDWAQQYPQYVVSAWLGHGIEVSARHYLQVPEELYNKVATTNTSSTATKTATKSKKERTSRKFKRDKSPTDKMLQ